MAEEAMMSEVPATLVDVLLAGRDRPGKLCFAFFPDGETEVEQQIDYDEFVARALRIATGLRAVGIASGAHVGLVARPRVEYVLMLAAIWFNGGVAVPMNHLFKRRELIAYMTSGAVTAVFVDETTAPLIAEIAPDVPGLGVLISTCPVDGFSSVLLADLERSEPAVTERPHREATAVLMHTSGTTGLPKAVVRTHGTYADFAVLWARFCMRDTDRIFSFMPMYHQAGLLVHWLPAYLLGLPFFQIERFSPAPFWDVVRRYELTTGLFMPPVPTFLLATPESPDEPGPIEWAFAVSPPDVWRAFQERFRIPMHGGYGSTETTMVGMSGGRADGRYSDEDLDLPLGGSVMGKPLPDWCEMRIADAGENVVPPLTFGEVQVRGPGVLKEYYNNPAATKAAFTRDGWFKSGDVGYYTDDGRFVHVDRTKNLIRRSGENIAPAEIEEVLMEHPGVAEVAVVPVEDEIRGQEIRACVVPAPGSEITAADVFALCAAELSAFKVPRYVEFLDSLPHTPTFKIQKDQLIGASDRSRWVDRLATA